MQTNQAKAAQDAAAADDFQVDPLVQCLFREGHTAPGYTLPLIAAWPVDEDQWGDSYAQLLTTFKNCWNPDSIKALYLYPLEHLHVTIATCFRDITRDVPSLERTELVDKWRQVLQHAAKLPEWPQKPLKLVLDSVQVGRVACILLWKDSTGGVQAIRSCLVQAVKDLSHLQVEPFGIPDIIHTTFCRFVAKPNAQRSVVQEMVAKNVVPRLVDYFPRPIIVPTCKLVSELRPYMHIPHDDEHAHVTLSFGVAK